MPSDDLQESGLLFENTQYYDPVSGQLNRGFVFVQGGKIVACGEGEVPAGVSKKSLRVISVPDSLLLPGFVDSHVHLESGGFCLTALNLRECKTREDALDAIADYAKTAPGNGWIRYGNWNHENWDNPVPPKRDELDSILGSRPCLLRRTDGHVAVANSAAFHLAGIDENSPNPEGGLFGRDDRGRLNGLLYDTAISRVSAVIPPYSREARLKAIESACELAVQNGLTGVHALGESNLLRLMYAYRDMGKLNIRVGLYPYLSEEYSDIPADIEALSRWKDQDDEMCYLLGIKCFLDGSLGAGSAAFEEPYCDDPENRGLVLMDGERFYLALRECTLRRLQLTAHAIGDAAVRAYLDGMGRLQKSMPEVFKARHRIEHAQSVKSRDFDDLARSGCVLSMQPCHLLEDAKYASKRLGERQNDLYRFCSFIARQIPMAFGTDWPVEDLNPVRNIYAAAARPLYDKCLGFTPQESIGIAEAVYASTAGPAYAEFSENSKGRISPGAKADLTLLDGNLLQSKLDKIQDIKAVMTIVNGRVVYE